MNWIVGMQKAIDYIEENITQAIDYSEVAKIAYSSNFYFQRVFSILFGLTVGEYIRYRRLSLAGEELIESDDKVINIALKYGYDTPESFTKAFTRFHGVTPTAARKPGVKLKLFNRLLIQVTMKGGEIMDCGIEEKDEMKFLRKQVLGDLEVVRKYPRTFLGSTSTKGLHHMVYEVVINAIHEAIAGYCTDINVIVKKDDIIEVSDNGRGIPTFNNRETGISILESVFTTLYDKGKGFNGVPVFHDFNEVGVAVVNALSEWLEVEVCDGITIKHIKFERGNKVSNINTIGKTDSTGTTVRFKPDPEIFDDTTFDYPEILSKFEELASLHEKFTITVIDQRSTVEDRVI